MPRADLLALSPEDLAALTNRGTVKRAQRELEANEVTGDLREDADGTVSVRWSDGVECRLPAGAVLRQGRCTCVTAELCRHLVRSVLAYQRQSSATTADPVHGPWDPGTIADGDLAKHFKPAVLTRLRRQFDDGLLIEVVRSRKPTARFHELASTVRFPVPGDIRYSHCDCAQEAPCDHVPLAIWAFHRLDVAQAAGLVSTAAAALAVPSAVLDDVEAILHEWVGLGFAGATRAWRERVVRTEGACRAAGLVWPAEVLAELVQQHERYLDHDALFNPPRVVDLIGELLIRCDAIRNDTGAVPQLLIRGSRSDHATELGAARFIGLGCAVELRRRSTELTAYLQDADSGSVVAIGREFADPDDPREEPKPFAQLAQTPVVKGVSLAALGLGQLLVQGGKRAADHRLILGRARATVNPQGFAWENLRPPLFAEDFSEVTNRFGILPPASLRPRRVAEDLHVCAIAGVAGPDFVHATQTVTATLLDKQGQCATLCHAFTGRGGDGADNMLAALQQRGQHLRFVSGRVRLAADGLVIRPIALVFQDGATRSGLQPWVDRRTDSKNRRAVAPGAAVAPSEPIEGYLADLIASLADLWLVGLERTDANQARRWQELSHQGAALGFARVTEAVATLARSLESKGHVLCWDWKRAAHAVLDLCVLIRLGLDLAAS
ncbi:MAG: hypothetical protein K2R98_07725 [Gemmataceae bacterium]|nr:hypothetical protein [Gemmataceae bacterium]